MKHIPILLEQQSEEAWRVDMMSVRSTIASQFEQVAKEQKKDLAPLSDDLVLLESGLDSLCFAIIVARLEDALGVDPFSAAEDAEFPVTLGDFVKFYENAAK
jgi:acyl carrier protein